MCRHTECAWAALSAIARESILAPANFRAAASIPNRAKGTGRQNDYKGAQPIMSFIFLPEDASRARVREAENARKNRAEILKAYSQGQVSRRELFKWGLFTTAGALAPIHGLNPFVSSAYASGSGGGTSIPTGAPRSPLFGVQAFSTPMPRFDLISRGSNPLGGDLTPIPCAQSNQTLQTLDPALVNGQVGLKGPIEGRPPGEIWAHQQFGLFPPRVSVEMSQAQ